MHGEKTDRIRSEIPELARGIFREFRSKQLLVMASAISFRVISASIPAILFVVAALGALQLEQLWEDEAVPALRDAVSPAVFDVIDDAVTRVFERETTYWVTIGAVLALFGMASIVDAVTNTLNRIHEVEESRHWAERVLNTALIGAAVGLLLLAAVATVRLGPIGLRAIFGDGIAADILGFILPWLAAATLLMSVVTILARVAPDIERPIERVSKGAIITVSGWIGASVLFGLFLRYIAAYDSILGSLATIYIAVQYIALSAIVFVAGLVVDCLAVARNRQEMRSQPGASSRDPK